MSYSLTEPAAGVLIPKERGSSYSVGTTAPTNVDAGAIWVDTSVAGTPIMKMYMGGSVWQQVNSLSGDRTYIGSYSFLVDTQGTGAGGYYSYNSNPISVPNLPSYAYTNYGTITDSFAPSDELEILLTGTMHSGTYASGNFGAVGLKMGSVFVNWYTMSQDTHLVDGMGPIAAFNSYNLTTYGRDLAVNTRRNWASRIYIPRRDKNAGAAYVYTVYDLPFVAKTGAIRYAKVGTTASMPSSTFQTLTVFGAVSYGWNGIGSITDNNDGVEQQPNIVVRGKVFRIKTA